VILETLSGQKTIGEACEALGMNEAAFHKLRSRFLSEAVESLEPRPVGRKPKMSEADSEQVEKLRREVQELERELKASRVREEIALSMPQLSREDKKKRRGTRKRD
jgi:hypothetical protein